MNISSSLANFQRVPTEIDKTGDIVKLRILVEQVILQNIYGHSE